ncbi:putative permease, DMT superfamily [Rickettsiales bacterium Ac37b]|nr:putative permease, DMT superfamily [Rickettsiales bacterium Ac37b]
MNDNVNFQYIQAVLWFVASILISAGNDLLAKLLGGNLHHMQITFLRFFFSMVTLLPVMFCYKEKFKTDYLLLHVLRGTILCIAIILWIQSLNSVPIILATIISFTIPLFFIILARLFLNEYIGWQRGLVTLVGFCGILVLIIPAQVSMDSAALLLLVASILFASLDILNKKFVTKETMLNMMFYSSLVAVLIVSVPAYIVWNKPTSQDLILCFVLGCGANLILFALLKAFSMSEASALSPFRYLELFFTAVLGYIFFSDIPNMYHVIGAAIIIPSTLILVYYESIKKDRLKNCSEVSVEVNVNT